MRVRDGIENRGVDRSTNVDETDNMTESGMFPSFTTFKLTAAVERGNFFNLRASEREIKGNKKVIHLILNRSGTFQGHRNE